jgi:hypothetical protein
MSTLADSSVIDAVVARIRRVTPDSERQWGTMTPGEMICHLADSYKSMLGERERIDPPKDTLLSRTVVKWIALHSPLPWPKGIMTMTEVDPRRGGTRPDVFERDRDALVALVRRFAAADARHAPHPMFGPLTRGEGLTWGYRHADHHLRQFGV